MKAILLAGGRGTRISKEINDIPKCTLKIDKTTPLIRYTVELFLKNSIDVAVVVGFKRDLVIDALKDLPIKFYTNPFYSITNSIASLWFARDFWIEDEDILIMNGDVYLEQDLIESLLKDDLLINVNRGEQNTYRYPVMLADNALERRIKGDFFFKYENNILQKYGKELDVDDRTGEYIGIAKMCRSFRNIFLSKMEKMISLEKYDKWWENVLYELSDSGVNIYVQETNFFWGEIDNISDYQNILTYKTKTI